MKTNYYLKNLWIPITCLFTLWLNAPEAKAQTWPMPGATWEYCITGWGGMPAGHLMLGINGDTLINNRTYTIISRLDDSVTAKEDSPLFTLYTRFSNDTVYRYVNNREYLYFNFNSNTGDVYTTFRSAGFSNNWSDSACTSVLPIKTMQVDTMMVNEMPLRRTILRDTLFKIIYSLPDDDEVEYTLLERIGIIDGLPLINSKEMKGYSGGGCSLPSDYATFTLGSYSDDGYSVQFSTCLGVGIDELEERMSNIKVYPNPASAFVAFEIPRMFVGATLHNQTIFISDIYGRPVAEVPVIADKTVWDASIVASGVYLYCFRNGQYTSSGKFLILK